MYSACIMLEDHSSHLAPFVEIILRNKGLVKKKNITSVRLTNAKIGYCRHCDATDGG